MHAITLQSLFQHEVFVITPTLNAGFVAHVMLVTAIEIINNTRGGIAILTSGRKGMRLLRGKLKSRMCTCVPIGKEFQFSQ